MHIWKKRNEVLSLCGTEDKKKNEIAIRRAEGVVEKKDHTVCVSARRRQPKRMKSSS